MMRRAARPPAAARALAAVLVPPAAPRLAVTRRRLGAVAIALALGAFAVAEAAGVAAGPVAWAAQGVVVGVLLGHAWRARGGAALALGAAAGAALAAPGAWAAHVAGGGGLAASLWHVAATAGFALVAARMAAGDAALPAGADNLRRAVRLADYPLVGTVAIATPGVWLAAAVGPRGAVAAGAVAAFGAACLAGARASRGPAATGGLPATVTLAVAWAVVSAAPLAIAAGRAAGGVAAAAGAAALATGLVARCRAAERRFERRALLHAAPALAAGAGALLLTPSPPTPAVWTGAWLALALLGGYAASQADGRVEWAARVAWRRLGPFAALGAALGEVTRAVATGELPDPVRGVAAYAAARLGAEWYHAHRAHVRALRAVGLGDPVQGRGYIRRPWEHPGAPSSTPARWSAPSSAWPTNSSS